jgi:hypothetical protein
MGALRRGAGCGDRPRRCDRRRRGRAVEGVANALWVWNAQDDFDAEQTVERWSDFAHGRPDPLIEPSSQLACRLATASLGVERDLVLGQLSEQPAQRGVVVPEQRRTKAPHEVEHGALSAVGIQMKQLVTFGPVVAPIQPQAVQPLGGARPAERLAGCL